MNVKISIINQRLFFRLLILFSILLFSQYSFAQNIVFKENKGQWEPNVLFKADLPQGALFVEKTGLTFLVHHPDKIKSQHLSHENVKEINKKTAQQSHAYKLHFKNILENVEIKGEDSFTDYSNYFYGNDTSEWVHNVKHFNKIIFKNLYRGIDFCLYSQSGLLKYDLIVNPSAKVNDISFEYEGLNSIKLAKSGILELNTSVGNISELKPYIYQNINQKEKKIEGKYVLKNNLLSFELNDYDTTKTVCIDPELVFSTYTGSTADNWGYTATYDQEGYAYTAGIVFNQGYPVNIGAYDETFNGNADIAIMKLSPDGKNRIYATYLGGSYGDMPHSLIVNELGELVIFGTTGSPNFPTTPNAYNRIFKGSNTPLIYVSAVNFLHGSDIFVAKLNATGSQLLASTFIGGSDNDGLNYKPYFNDSVNVIKQGNDSLYNSYGDGARGELIIDDQNNIYVGSCTFSTDFPTTQNAFQKNSNGKQEGIIFKLDNTLSNLIFSSYLGGSGDDAIYSIYTDSKYDLVVTGGTNSTNFPTTPGAYQQNYNGGSADGFVAKISYGGNSLIYSTYFGTEAYDQSFFARLDKEDNIYITGQTKHAGQKLIKNANYKVAKGSQFVTELTPTLSDVVWSTVFGSGDMAHAPDLSLSAFTVDVCKRISISGWGRWWVNDYTIPRPYGTTYLETTPNAYQKRTDGQDFYLMCLEPQASALNYATFFGELHTKPLTGNDHVDGGTSRFDKMGTLYQSVCASCQGSQHFPIFPTGNVWSDSNRSSNCNNAIFKFKIANDFAVASFKMPTSLCVPATIQFTNTGRGNSYEWDFGDGSTSSDESPQHTYLKAGIYTITQYAKVSSGCYLNDTLKKQLIILDNIRDTLAEIITCPELPTQIGLTPTTGLTYKWNTTTGITNPTVANPFVTVNKDTWFNVIVSNGSCTDTLYQLVKVRYLPVDAGNNKNSCISPEIVHATTPESNVNYVWSSNNLFTDTLNAAYYLNSAELYLEQSQWYYVKVSNSNMCWGVDSIFIDYKKIATTSIIRSPNCYGICNGVASILANNAATPPVSYSWKQNNVVISRSSTDTTLCAGTAYYATILDGKGCSRTEKVTLANTIEIIIQSNITAQGCSNYCNGKIETDVRGGIPPYSYLWSTGSTSPNLENICQGTYNLTVTDSKLCQKGMTYVVPKDPGFGVHLEKLNNTCSNFCTGSATAYIQNGKSPPYAYTWNNGKTDSTINNICGGLYEVIVTDSLGCLATDTITVLDKYTFENMHVWADTTTILETHSTYLHASSLDSVLYEWRPTKGLSSPYDSVTLAQPQNTTWYHLKAIDKQGCIYKDSLKIEVIIVECGPPNIKVPNAFTPNGDGNNDYLCIQQQWIREYYFAIFNRWGEKVFESKNPNDCWDGTFKNKMCESGVYMYTLQITCDANKTYQTKGDITLIR